MPKIAELEIQITNKATGATKSLRNLQKALSDIQGVKSNLDFSNVQTGGLEKLYRYVNSLTRIMTPLADKCTAVTNAFSKLGSMGGTNFQSLTKKTEKLNESLQSISTKSASASGGQALAEGMEKVKTASAGVANSTENARRHIVSLSISSKKLSSVFASLAKVKDRVASGFKRLTSSFKGIGNAVKALGSHLPKVNTGFGGMIKQFGRLFKLKLMRQIVQQVMQAFREGIGNLYEYSRALGSLDSSNFKNTMDGYSTALQTMKNSVAAAVAPLLQALLPAFQTLTSWIVAATNALNQFLSLLMGKSTYTRAKNQMKEYAEATGGAAESAQELQRTIMGFDEINKLNDNNSGGGGGGGGGADFEDMFEEANIGDYLPEKVLNLFEEMKKALDEGNWKELGRLVAEGLNMINDAIDDWNMNVFRPKAREWAKNISDVLNGLFENWDAKKAGATLRELINTVLLAIDDAIRNFDWATAGKRLGEFLNSLFDQKLASNLGKTLADWFDGILQGAIALLDQNVGGELGKSLAEFLNALFDKGKNGNLGKAIAGIINNLSAFFKELFEGLDWKGLGEAIAANVYSAVDGIDYQQISDAIKALLDGALELALTLSENDVSGKLGEGVAKLFNALFDATKNGQLGAILGEILNHVTSFFKGIFTNLDWAGLGESLSANIIALVRQVNYDEISNTLKALLDGALIATTKMVEAGVGGEVGRGVANMINAMFDSAKNGQLGAIAGNIINVLTDFILGVVDGVKWAELGATLAQNVISLVETINPETIGEAVAKALNGVVDLIWAFFDKMFTPDQNGKLGIQKMIEFVFDSVASFIENVDINRILAAILSILARITLSIPSMIVSLLSGLVSLLKPIVASIFGDEIAEAGVNAIKTHLDKVSKDWNEVVVDPVTKDLNKLLGLEETYTSTATNDASETAKKISSQGKELLGDLIGYGGTFKSDYSSISKELEEKVNTHLQGAAKEAKSQFSNIERYYKDTEENIAKNAIKLKANNDSVIEKIEHSHSAGKTLKDEIENNPIKFKGNDDDVQESMNGVLEQYSETKRNIEESTVKFTSDNHDVLHSIEESQEKYTTTKDNIENSPTNIKGNTGDVENALAETSSKYNSTKEKIELAKITFKEQHLDITNALKDVSTDYETKKRDIENSPIAYKGSNEDALNKMTSLRSKFDEDWKYVKKWAYQFKGDNSDAIGALDSIWATFKQLYDDIAWSPLYVSADVSSARASINSLWDSLNAVQSSFNGVSGNVLTRSTTRQYYAEGGFPDTGSLFIAGEAGAEMVGNINGRTGVASQSEITGIADAVYSSSEREAELLSEQNGLLREILEKSGNGEINVSSVLNAMGRVNRRTGKTVVAMGM